MEDRSFVLKTLTMMIAGGAVKKQEFVENVEQNKQDGKNTKKDLASIIHYVTITMNPKRTEK